jgi:hypothetical protein
VVRCSCDGVVRVQQRLDGEALDVLVLRRVVQARAVAPDLHEVGQT